MYEMPQATSPQQLYNHNLTKTQTLDTNKNVVQLLYSLQSFSVFSIVLIISQHCLQILEIK